MPYLYSTDEEVREMLGCVGVSHIDDLFEQIPAPLRFQGDLKIPAALDEYELTQHMHELSEKNAHVGAFSCFLGGGAYDHFIPAAVDMLASRGEFYTSYTPYQPEVSQGNLQAIFEYQSMICAVTGMDVSNASVYDGATATVEAVLMSVATTKRTGNVVVMGGLHPEYRTVVKSYLDSIGVKLSVAGSQNGVADLSSVESLIDSETACVVIQHPNFFGCLEDVAKIAETAKRQGAVVVQVFDPISLGLLQRPGDMGADIAVAEGQSLGNPLAFGGPYLGILACKESFVRRLPGRIAGQTLDHHGKRCFVLTLQTREQHIRRDKATSNICTNQGLFALRASIYLALLGPQGLKEVATACAKRAKYAVDAIVKGGRFKLAFDAPFFKEVALVDTKNDVSGILAAGRDKKILAGLPLGTWDSSMNNGLLVAFTEKRTKGEIDSLVGLLK